MYSRIRSAICVGLEGRDVYVETDISRGLPGIGLVGLPSTTVMESRERIKSAIINSGFAFPKGKITINLTPAGFRKNSSCLDLPIAIGILASNGCIERDIIDEWGIIGELTLDGRILGVDGALPMILHMKDMGTKGIIAPAANYEEAVLAGGNICLVEDLCECVDALENRGKSHIMKKPDKNLIMEGHGNNESYEKEADFADIAGQESAKRAALIAAAGRHGLLMVGSPGCGKTMIALRIAGIMPAMSEREILETAIVRSSTGTKTFGPGEIIRPFRAPHHSIGKAGLIGGGLYPVPGEITLAHNGLLFLDEVCEFDRDTIESLRIPMEEKKISHFRRGEIYTFPCNFQIVMAANPCPCGYLGDSDRECTCSQADLDRYKRKLSGPIIDRIDMRISMKKVNYDDLTGTRRGVTTAEMREKVTNALLFAKENGRFGYNAELSDREIEDYCRLGPTEKKFLNKAYDSLHMSPRSYSKTLKVARTIADLDESISIKTDHIAEALSYRMNE